VLVNDRYNIDATTQLQQSTNQNQQIQHRLYSFRCHVNKNNNNGRKLTQKKKLPHFATKFSKIIIASRRTGSAL
jgi:hypothetical protein